MAAAIATVSTVSSVKRELLWNRGNSVVLIGRASYTEPMMSPAMAPSILRPSFLRVIGVQRLLPVNPPGNFTPLRAGKRRA
jgi:hypothetical protein